ncbi:MAG: hypothetical protein M1823_006684, partial [Watsoniomyces obsoletus]
MSGQDLDTDYTTFPIQWKRLQFRIATANNGRRKELQQHFTLHLKIMASLSTGGKISIAESQSGAIIVRGRSPRNFAARKDLPLSSSSTARKHISVLRSSQTSVPQVTSAPKAKTPSDEVPQMVMHYDNKELHSADDMNNWSQVGMRGEVATPYSASMNPPVMPSLMHDTTPEGGTPNPFAFTFMAGMGSSGPESLHFSSDDEGSPHPPHQRKTSRQTSAAPPTSNPSPNLLNRPRGTTFASA